MATTTPNFGWAVPTSTDLVKDGAVAIETLGDSIDASLVDLKGGTTGQVLAKATNTDMDFSWVTTDDTNAIQNAIVDAKGDIIAATANDTPARLAVGANDLVLTAASGEATGLKYGGAWTTWTPTINNFTLGNGTRTARYCQTGKVVTFSLVLTLGSTSVMNGSPNFTLPVAVGSGFSSWCNLLDTGTAVYFANGFRIADVLYLDVLNASGTYVGATAFTATVPFTWTTGDSITVSGSYEAA